MRSSELKAQSTKSQARAFTYRLAALVMLSSCGVDHISRIEPSVELQPTVLDFGRVIVGEPERRVVTVTNRTNAPLELSAEVGAPFFLSAPRLTLAGAESRLITVELLASVVGPLQGVLKVQPGGTIALLASAVSREECGVPEACQTFTRECERAVSPDGTPCNTACVTSSTCVAGRCVGTPVDCDDQNLCTSDSCGESGCAHAVLTCDVPADPCKAARCDPALGCVTFDVSDGTSCGANDCSTAMVCITGRCVARAAPEGSTCAGAGLCREESRCVAGACVAGRSRPVRPAWTFSLQGSIDQRGLRAGDDGNIYFLERARPAPFVRALVSLDPHGRLRFRVATRFGEFDSPMLLVSEGVVV